MISNFLLLSCFFLVFYLLVFLFFSSVISVFSDCSKDLLYSERKIESGIDNHMGGIVNQVFESLSLCDDSIKRELMQNVLLSGGTSLLPGKVFQRYFRVF